MNQKLLIACAALVAIASACNKSSSEPAAGRAGTGPAPEVAEADQLFSMRCSPCHGATGAGDGSASAALNPKPRNFHDKSWQTSVADEQIEKIIREGGTAVGKSPGMPPNPDLVSKPLVIRALVAKIRGLSTP